MPRHNREITIKKADLIAKVKQNKAAHIKAFEQAVIDYKKEAALQLETQTKELGTGSLKIHVNLITPINSEAEYDKIVSMFEWEIKDEVVLDQSEFNEYVLGATQFAIMAELSNSAYRGKF
jgi:hypothetical protein